MNNATHAISVNDFIDHPEVKACLEKLTARFGKEAERLVVSDVIDKDGHQYVNLVQKGGGVLGVALVGYTYILEKMNIRFIRQAGTSAGAINTALMTIIGGKPTSTEVAGEIKKVVKGDKKSPKSEAILKAICELNFFDLVDGHPAARRLIKRFITNKDFVGQLKKKLIWMVVILFALPILDLICLGLQHQVQWVSYITITLFIVTGLYILSLVLLIVYALYLFNRLKDSGFGINPGDFFYDWIKDRMEENDVYTVSDLVSKAETPVEDLHLRVPNEEGIKGLEGDVTFIASELVTQNKIEFPKMWKLFRKDMDQLHPAGFVRASMSIPIFFESYFIDEIPCTTRYIKEAWKMLGENDPPSTARFVDGGILSNFPINLFYNPNVNVPRLPSFGIDLDDGKDPKEVFPVPGATIAKVKKNNKGKNAFNWSFGGYVSRLFNTVRFYYDKDFLIKNAFFKNGIGVIPLKGYGWLNFFLDNQAKKEMFVLGAKAATDFLEHFNWEDYKAGRIKMQAHLKEMNQPLDKEEGLL